jgi:hypothetical protein
VRRMGAMTRTIGIAAVLAVVAASCSGGSDGDEAAQPDPAVTDVSEAETTSDTEPAMRDIPTIPPPTIEGQTESDGGVIVVAPTIAPAPPPSVDPSEPAEPMPPPSTDLVGDPQPTPDSTNPAPPAPPEGALLPDPACDRLAPFDIEALITEQTGEATSGERVTPLFCRYASGSVVVEVHLVPVQVVRDDWYRREGIEPVGEVSGDAVGFSNFVTPSGDGGAGYTIATVGGSDGAIVAVSGTSDARLVASSVALFAQQAA